MKISEYFDQKKACFVYVCDGVKPSEQFRSAVFEQYSERVFKIEHTWNGTVGYSKPVYINY